MGLFDRLRSKPTPTPTPAQHWPAPPALPPIGPGFAVVDVETTGLSARHDRIIELAIVRTDPHGRTVDEWTCRFHPGGPVGATHIHGITDSDVAHAPPFAQVLPEVTRRLIGVAIAGHNVRFDLSFLRAEYAKAGWSLPMLPALCTLDASQTYLPHLDRRRLADCCHDSGIVLQHAHSALGDARATASLLRNYLDPNFGVPTRPEHAALAHAGMSISWPTSPGGVRPPIGDLPPRVQRKIKTPVPAAPSLIALLEHMRLADALDDGAPDGSVPYLELLAGVLEDGILTDDERDALGELAALYGLDVTARAATHRGFLLALAHLALDDGKVSRTENAELKAVSALLEVPEREVSALLGRAEAARHARLSANLQPLPADWLHGEPLRVGDKVVFTGCDDAERDRLEQRAEQLGVRVIGSVSARVALLVTDGGFHGGKAADAVALGLRTVTPDVFELLLQNLQPTALREAASVPSQRDPVGGAATSRPAAPQSRAAGGARNPAAMRAWARDNGFEVGVRGRLSAEITAAYSAAQD